MGRSKRIRDEENGAVVTGSRGYRRSCFGGSRLAILAGSVFVIAIVGVVVAAVLLITGRGGYDGDVATLLPATTIGYMETSDISKLQNGLEEHESGEMVREVILELGILTAEQLKECEEALKDVKSLHISVQKVNIDGDRTDVDALMILDVGLVGLLADWFPSVLDDILVPAEEYKGRKVYKYEHPKFSDAGLSINVSSANGSIFVATNRELLEETLDALENGRTDSLAQNKSYLRIMDGQEGKDSKMYLSVPALLNAIEGGLKGDQLREFKSIVNKIGLANVEALASFQDFDDKSGLMRVSVNESSNAYKLLLLLAMAPKKIPARLPADTMFLVSASISDGGELWRKGSDYVGAKLVSFDASSGKDAYENSLKQVEQEMNIKFEEAASIIDELGLFAYDSFKNVCFVAMVNDAEKAEKLLDEFAMLPIESRNIRNIDGVKVRVYGDGEMGGLAWAIKDDCVFISPSFETIRAAVSETKEKGVLSANEEYANVTAALPGDNAALIYLDYENFLNAVPGPGAQAFPPAMRDLMKGMFIAESLTFHDGIVEIRVAQSKQVNLGESFGVMMGTMLPALTNAREEARKAVCKSNLKQIGLGCHLFAGDHEDRFPEKLSKLYPDYMPNMKLFACPSTHDRISSAEAIDTDTNYIYLGGSLADNSQNVLAYEKPRNHRGWTNVLFVGGHVQWIDRFGLQQMLKVQNEKKSAPVEQPTSENERSKKPAVESLETE